MSSNLFKVAVVVAGTVLVYELGKVEEKLQMDNVYAKKFTEAADNFMKSASNFGKDFGKDFGSDFDVNLKANAPENDDTPVEPGFNGEASDENDEVPVEPGFTGVPESDDNEDSSSES